MHLLSQQAAPFYAGFCLFSLGHRFSWLALWGVAMFVVYGIRQSQVPAATSNNLLNLSEPQFSHAWAGSRKHNPPQVATVVRCPTEGLALACL